MKLYITLYAVMSLGLFKLGFEVMRESFTYSLGWFQITHDGLGLVLYMAGLCLIYAAMVLAIIPEVWRKT